MNKKTLTIFCLLMIAGASAFAPRVFAEQRIAVVGDIEGIWPRFWQNLLDLEALDLAGDQNDVPKIRTGRAVSFLGDIVDRGEHSFRILRLINLMRSRQPNQVLTFSGNRDANKPGRLSWNLFDNLEDPQSEGGPYFRLRLNEGRRFNRLSRLEGNEREMEVSYQREFNGAVTTWMRKVLGGEIKAQCAQLPQVEKFFALIKSDLESGSVTLESLAQDPMIRLIYQLQEKMGAGRRLEFTISEIAEIRAGLESPADIERYFNEKHFASSEDREWREAMKAKVASEKANVTLVDALLLLTAGSVSVSDVTVITKSDGLAHNLSPELGKYKGSGDEYLRHAKIVHIDRPTMSIGMHGFVPDELDRALNWIPNFAGGSRWQAEKMAGQIAEQMGIPVNQVLNDAKARAALIEGTLATMGSIDPELASLDGETKGFRLAEKLNTAAQAAAAASGSGISPADVLEAYDNPGAVVAMSVLSFMTARSTDGDSLPKKLTLAQVGSLKKITGFPRFTIYHGHTPVIAASAVPNEGFVAGRNEIHNGQPVMIGDGGGISLGIDLSFSPLRAFTWLREGGDFQIVYRVDRQNGLPPRSFRITRGEQDLLAALGRKVRFANAEGKQRVGMVVGIDRKDGYRWEGLILDIDPASGFRNSINRASLDLTGLEDGTFVLNLPVNVTGNIHPDWRSDFQGSCGALLGKQPDASGAAL